MEERSVLISSRRKNWFWDYNSVFDSPLSAYAKLVRLYLARCADNTTRQAFPSLSNIAEHCGISRATAKRAISELIEKGWLKKETRRDEQGAYTTNLYVLCGPDEEGRFCENLPCNEMTPPGSQGTGGYAHREPGDGSQGAPNNTNLTIPKVEQDSKIIQSSSKGSLRSPLELLTEPDFQAPATSDKKHTKTPEAASVSTELTPEGEMDADELEPQTPLEETSREKPDGPGIPSPGENDQKQRFQEKRKAPSQEDLPDEIFSLTNKDLITMLGDSLREVWDGPPAKAYAIAGRMYYLYDFPAAEYAIEAFRRSVEKGFRPRNPVAYLFKIAREKKKELVEPEEEHEEPLAFAQKYPEEHARRMEEVRRIYAEREKRLQEILALDPEPPPEVPGFTLPKQVFERGL